MNIPEMMLPLMNSLVLIRRVKTGDNIERRVDEISEILPPTTEEGLVKLAPRFKWDAKTDTFKHFEPKKTEQHVLKQIGTIANQIPLEQIKREIEVKETILDWMMKIDVKDYKEVQNIVRNYYLKPEEALNQAKNGDCQLTAADKIPLQIIGIIQNTLDSWEKSYFKELRETYEESGLQTLFSDYTRKVNIISAFVFSLTLVISVAVNEMILGINLGRNIISSLALSTSLGTISLIIGHIKPMYQRNQNKNYLENNLIYSLSYMSCLSSSGMPIERIFRE